MQAGGGKPRHTPAMNAITPFQFWGYASACDNGITRGSILWSCDKLQAQALGGASSLGRSCPHPASEAAWQTGDSRERPAYMVAACSVRATTRPKSFGENPIFGRRAHRGHGGVESRHAFQRLGLAE